MASVEHVE